MSSAAAAPTDEATARAASQEMQERIQLQDMERKCNDLEKDRQVWYDKAKAQEAHAQKIQKDADALSEKLEETESKYQEELRQKQQYEEKVSQLTTDATLAQERTTRTQIEADKLREEISHLSKSKSELQNQVSEWEVKAKLGDSAVLPLQYQVMRLEKEVDSIGVHSKWLEEELAQRSQDLAESRQTHSTQVLELRQELDQMDSDRTEMTLTKTRQESSIQLLEQQVETLSQELRTARSDASFAKEASQKEVDAERKLVQLQRDQLDRIKSRHDRLENEVNGLRDIARKSTAEMEKEVQAVQREVQEQADKVLAEQQTMYLKQIAELKKERHQNTSSVTSPLLTRRAILTSAEDGEPMGLADLYAKLNQAEDDLKKERSECRMLRGHLRNIESDIAAKTPKMQRQRREYEASMDRLEEVQDRLRHSSQETKVARDEAVALKSKIDGLEKRNHQLEGENEDLAKHVQALLVSKAGGDPGELHAGIPVSVSEIQQQNRELMNEHRRLATEVKELQSKLDNDSTAIQLEDAQAELTTLLEERSRQETYMSSIVQQRDLYRAIVNNQLGDSSADLADTERVVAQHNQEAREAEKKCKALEQEVAATKASLTVMKGDKDSLTDRVERGASLINDLTASVDKLQNELATANGNAARSEVDATYHRDKCVRAEQSLEQSRDEVKRLQDSKKEILDLNNRLQQQLAASSIHATKVESDIRALETKLRLANSQAETAKAAEMRQAEEVARLRTELARQGELLEKVHKIEASLSARNAETNEKMQENVERLTVALEKERSKQGINAENIESRVKELEVAVREAESTKEQALKDLVAAKEESLGLSKEHQILVAKVTRLESQTKVAGASISSLVGGEKSSSNKQEEKVNEESDQTKAELVAAKQRVANFEKVAKTAEKELQLQTKATEEFKKAKSIEIEGLNKKYADAAEECKQKDLVVAELMKDLAAVRGDQGRAEASLKETIAGLEATIEGAKKDAAAAMTRADALSSEIENCRSESEKSKSDYERELDQHAAARVELRTAREEALAEKRSRKAAEDTLENSKVEITAKENSLDQEKKRMQEGLDEMESKLKSTSEMNDRLLSQLATLGEQVEQFQAKRIEAATDTEADPGEADGLRKTISDLREVINFVRSERDMHQAQIDAARRTAEREKVAASVTLRSLEEARAELSTLQQSKSTAIGSSSVEYDEKLKATEEQVALLRDSNSLLREEAEKVQNLISATKAELTEKSKLIKSLEEKQRTLSGKHATLLSEKESLQREVDAWKNRVQKLVSNFNQVDPVEHTKALADVESLKQEVAALKKDKHSSEKEGSSAKTQIAKLNKELNQSKALLQKHQNLMKKMKTDKESAAKASSETASLMKERDQMKEKIQKLESEFTSTKTELKGATDRIELLKTRMRQFQKIIGEQKKKINALEASVASPAPVETTASVPVPPAPAATGQPTTTLQDQSASKPKPKLSEAKEELTSGAQVEGSPTVPTGGFKFGPSSEKGKAVAKSVEPSTKKAKVVGGAPKKAVVANPQVASKKEEVVPLKMEPSKRPLAGKSDDQSPAKKAKVTQQNDASQAGSATEPDAQKQSGAKATDNQDALQKAKLAKQQQVLALKEKLRKRKLEKEASQHAQSKRANIDDDAKSVDSADIEEVVDKETSPAAKSVVTIEAKSIQDKGVQAPVNEKVLAGEGKKTTEISQKKADESSGEPPKTTLNPNAPVFGTPFGSGGSTFGSGAMFGTTSFGKPPGDGGGMMFPSSSSIGGFGSASTKKDSTAAGASSSVFLDMKPPSSTAAPFSFGSSSIKLPTPSVTAPSAPSGTSPFGAFGGSNPFGSPGPSATNASSAKPLFGSSTSIVASAAGTAPTQDEGKEKGEDDGDADEK